MTFKFTAKQIEAQQVITGPAQHILLDGGGRSGKTFLHVRNTIMRALMAPASRHLMVRFRFNEVRRAICLETMPAVMRLCFAGVTYHLDKQDWFAKLGEDAEIWFGGLDDKERTEKILGKEYATVLMNECSQISYSSRQMVLTRLAQRVMRKVKGQPEVLLPTRAYYDANPPSKAHWTYKLFYRHIDPESRLPLTDPQNYAVVKMNPRDNVENISPEYLKTLAGLSPRMRRRFELGEYEDENPNALFAQEWIDRYRLRDGELPQLIRVVVAVDPSGSGDEDTVDHDEIGIVVAGLGIDGNAYVLEDCSVNAGPGTWGNVATTAFDRHLANVIVGETNFGGDMVRATIQASRPRTPFKKVTASRGKAVRAEPFSALYEQGKVRHAGDFNRLEDELIGLSTIGYTGQGSPNRADALIWALAELFPGLVSARADRRLYQGRELYAET